MATKGDKYLNNKMYNAVRNVLETWKRALKAFIPHKLSNTAVLNWYKRLSWKISDKKILANRENNVEVLTEAANIAANGKTSFYHRNGYIENQSQWGAVKFGSYHMAYSGCEIMATYNALWSLGNKMTETEMIDLISTYENNGASLSGRFGVAPTAILDYFQTHGYDAAMTVSMEQEAINVFGREYDTIIITVYNNADDITNQIHTMNVSKNRAGRFYIHNGYYIVGGKYAPKGPFASLWEVIQNSSNQNAAPISIIGINRP